MHYLLNSAVLTDFGHWAFRGPLSLDQARGFLEAAAYTSAIGHAPSARYLSRLLGLPVAHARREITMKPGDVALVFRIHQRLGEGVLLDEDTLARLPQSFGLLERLD
ncbi:MAG: STIV orfB116 family protein [Casimicrobiaceae bacterium]